MVTLPCAEIAATRPGRRGTLREIRLLHDLAGAKREGAGARRKTGKLFDAKVAFDPFIGDGAIGLAE
jgi:hypothetical protein